MTNYSLVVRNIEDYNEFQKLTDGLKEFDLCHYVFGDGEYFIKEKEAIFCAWEEQKWNSYNGQMIILSEKYPKMTFELTCNEGLDFWRVYYKDGKAETCVGDVVFERPQNIVWDALLAF